MTHKVYGVLAGYVQANVAVGLAAAGSAESWASLNVTVVVLDGFGAERRDWVVEVVGAGHGVGEAKTYAGA